MTVIWGVNYSVIKAALGELPPLAFNALRLALASTLFLGAIAVRARRIGARPITRRDWAGIAALGFSGQCVYQLLFITGIARTTAANASLLIGCTPVFVALLAAALGHERVTATGWIGTLLSAVGIYLIVGHAPAVSRATVAGDLLMLTAVVCWSAVTVASRILLVRHPPLVVTGYAMAIGTVCFVPFAWPELHSLAWTGVSAGGWAAIGFSGTFALFISYVIWFTGIQRFGNTRTSIYSNMVPVVGMTVGWFWLGEAIGPLALVGAGAILAGVVLTKV